MKKIDLTGKKVLTYTVKYLAYVKGKNYFWECHCDICGHVKFVPGQHIRAQKGIGTCKCQVADKDTRDDAQRRLLRNVWSGMLDRCRNPNNMNYRNYGGRGILVCERWLSFENFVADMAPRPDGTSIDRINNNGNYEPENCRWATPTVQANNTRRNRYLEYNGEKLTHSQWAQRLGITPEAMRTRAQRGVPAEKLFYEGESDRRGKRGPNKNKKTVDMWLIKAYSSGQLQPESARLLLESRKS